MLIDGKLVGADATYPSVNPATGEVLGQAPDASEADARAAVAAARRAFDESSWSTDVAFRTRCLEQLHAALDAHREELRELTIADVGAPRGTTYGAQLDEPIEIVDYYAKLLPTFEFTEDLGQRDFMGSQHHRWVEFEAAGVVAAIIGYNYPTQLALAKLAPALAAGCTVILKAAPQDPLITLALGELIANETEIPPGVVNIISSPQVAVAEVLPPPRTWTS
jgi:acyl-CoA reductase-like NAD-dependent aldehyde dehydrogenase